MSYSVFAQYYDELTRNVEYAKRAEYFLRLLHLADHAPGLTLDLACGTGSLTLELYRRGVDVYGIDASVEMLSCAREKCAEASADILFLCQKMQRLDLYGTVNTVICSLDSINHLRDANEVREVFQKVSFFMEPGGCFLFDMNTPYKHRHVLANQTYLYDTPLVYCVWQNHYHPESCKVDIQLDFFEKEGQLYRRSSERFSERAYEEPEIRFLLEEAGFTGIQLYDELTVDPPKEDSQRIVVCARKK